MDRKDEQTGEAAVKLRLPAAAAYKKVKQILKGHIIIRSVQKICYDR